MTLHISRIQVENFKRIKDVDIDVDGQGVVTIGGRNAQGKSSIIDAIWNTLGGKQRDVSRPVRDGETSAKSTVTIEDTESGHGLVVTRTWKAGGASQIKVKPLRGSGQLSKPQDTLNDLIGAFAFDPLSFTTQTDAQQRQSLVDLIGLDLSSLDEEYDEAYEKRRAASVELKRIRGAFESTEAPARDLPNEFVSVTDLIKERDETSRVWAGIQNAEVTAESHTQQIAALTVERDELLAKAAKGRQWASARRSVEAVSDEIANAESTNHAIHAAQAYRDRKTELKAAEKTWQELENQVLAARQAKADALAAVDLPLEGLSFDEGGVLYKDVPLSQSSAAERREVSMAIAMAMNPDLKVICLKDASLLDEDAHKHIREMAEKNDYQLILEIVGNPGGDTIVIEDGEVA